jgi:hypothetical protein
MILELKSRPEPTMVEIDLTGPDGNVFSLINSCKELSRRFPIDVSFMQVQDEMMASKSYEEAINVFDSYFGEYVILYR